MRENPTPDSNRIRILSYNLWHGKAQRELGELVATHDPDVMCIQEARGSSLPRQLDGMQLAVTTARNRLGVALYTRASRFEIERALTYKLTTSRHDRLVGGTDHRLAAARVNDHLAGQRLVLASFHATPFTDSNAFRRRQVDEAHAFLGELGPGLPTVMAGDYNHPILLFMLQLHLKRRGIGLAHTPSSTFHKDGNLMRGKFDLATMSGLTETSSVTLPQAASDHMPVLFDLRYSDSVRETPLTRIGR
jgi:endonuclease/exonuclease/phosphatase (EEP) superfamily protein YafD